MKRASYREAVQWIADNDSGGDNLTEEECGFLYYLCISGRYL